MKFNIIKITKIDISIPISFSINKTSMRQLQQIMRNKMCQSINKKKVLINENLLNNLQYFI